MSTPDFRAWVRQRLPGLGAAAEEAAVVEELAAQLEDAYEAARADGLDAHAARARVELQLRQDADSWQQLDRYLRVHVAPTPAAPLVTWSSGFADRWIRDLRLALRHGRRDARFAATVTLTLAICIGVNTAVFAIVNRVLWQPLPFPDPDRVVLMAGQSALAAAPTGIRSDVPSYFDRLEQLTIFEEMAMFCWIDVAIDTSRGPERIRGDVGTPSLLRVIGVAPLHGRLFVDEDGQPGANAKVILSYELWQELYAGDPSAVGMDLALSGRPHTVVGIMPEGFGLFRLDARFWIPAVYTEAERADGRRGYYDQYQLGRLKPGVTLEQARQALAAFDRDELARFPALRASRTRNRHYTSVDPLQDVMTREDRPTLQLLWRGAIVVMLVGIITAASLTIARCGRQAGELATRRTLGAGRAHVARQLIAEGLVCGLAGGTGALVVAAIILAVVPRVGVEQIPRAAGAALDASAVLVAVGAALVAGLAIGGIPALWAIRMPLADALFRRARHRTGESAVRQIRRGLVVAQVAIAFALTLATVALFISFARLLTQNPGFTADRVTTVRFDIPEERYPSPADAARLTDRALAALRRMPGVTAAGVTQLLPFGGRTSSLAVRALDPAAAAPVVAWNYVISPGYFEALQVPLRAGRDFGTQDRPDREPVVIIDEVLAAHLFPASDPLGQRLVHTSSPSHPLTIVGVVAAVRQSNLTGADNDARGATYRVYTQAPDRHYALAIRTSAGAVSAPALRAAMRQVDRDLPLYDAATMSERLHRALGSRRVSLALAILFVATALLLATLGIYGVLSYAVVRRWREFGLRLALGGSASHLVRLVIAEGAALTGMGLLVGMLGVVWLRDVLRAHLYGVSATDPLVIGSAVALTASVAVIACVAPGRRVAGVDPATALAEE